MGARRDRTAVRALRRADRRLLPDRSPTAEFRSRIAVDLDARRPARHRRSPTSGTSRTGARTASPSAARVARAGYTVLVNKYYLDYLYTDVIVGGVKGPIARPPTGSTRTSSTASSTASASVARGQRAWVYDNIDQGVVDGVVNGSGAAAEGGGQSSGKAPDRQGAAVRRLSVRRRHDPRRRLRASPADDGHRGRSHVKDLLNDWGLSAAVFLPLRGRGGDDADPQGRGGAPQGGSPWSPRWPCSPSAIALAGQLRLRPDAAAAVHASNKQWIDVINSRYIVGLDGISLPLLLLTVFIVPLVIIYSWNHFPEPHNPKAFLILILILETGMVGTFVAQDLILFFVFFEVVLLPMYFMIGVWGGEQRQYAVDQVLPLHAVRLGADDRQLPGALLPVATGARRRRRCAHVRHARAARPRRAASRARPQAADLRRHVHRLRHQGADVPVPHLAARRAHPGAHAGLGDPGRRAAEARHVRLHPHRHPDPARRPRSAWAPCIGAARR